MQRNFGLLEELRDLGAYIFGDGNVPFIPYQPDGDWEPYLPKYENQTTRLGHETSGCTAHGALNQLETLCGRLYSVEPNYSERFTYIKAGIQPGKGTDPQNTHEAIRKYGVVDERDLPMTRTIEEYTNPSAVTPTLTVKGQEWLKRHEYKHEWLWKGQRPAHYKTVLKEALKSSPIGVSVTAWRQDENGLYVSGEGGNNHYCLLYRIDPDGVLNVFDSYDHTKKRLHPDHNIRRAKRIFLQKKTISAMRKDVSTLTKVLDFLTSLVKKNFTK